MAGYYHNIRGILPQMTSDTAPYPLASTASSSFSSMYYPWCAFRRYIGVDSGYSWNSLNNIPQWLKVYAGESTLPISAYTICATNGLNNTPRDWTLSGSYNNSDWDVINTQSGIMFTANEIKEFNLDSNASYKYYKIDVTAVYDGTIRTCGISEVEFLLATTGSYSHIPAELTIAMTGDSSPSSCAVTMSGTTVSGYEPYKAFTHNAIDSWCTSSGNTTGWLKYYSTSGLNVTSYFITCVSGIEVNSMPSAWTFEGSNDDTSWTTIDTQTGQTTWSGGYFKSYIFTNANYYKYHKLNISANNGNTDYLSIGEVEFLGKDSAGFCLDLVNGNDANFGLSWETPWKTIQTGASDLRTNAGDKIRIAKSPDPINTGILADFTNCSKTVTLSGALTKTIELCETAWTASANVTVTSDASQYKQGTKSAKLVFAAGFTTGLAAYKTLASPLDLSGYTGITFWTNASATFTAFEVCLCSTTSGTGIVDEFQFPSYPTGKTLGFWTPMKLVKGSALGSNIQSIAIYCTSDPATTTIYVDNFSACNDFSLLSLISKNITNGDQSWWPLQSINETTLLIDNVPATLANAGTGYIGDTETTILYSRETIPYTNNSVGSLATSGAAGNTIKFIAGYNTVTNEIDGLTFVDGLNGLDDGLYAHMMTYVDFTDICPVRFGYGFREYDYRCGYISFSAHSIVGCGYGLALNGSTPRSINVTYVTSSNTGGISLSGYGQVVNVYKILGGAGFGIRTSVIANANCTLSRISVQKISGLTVGIGVSIYIIVGSSIDVKEISYCSEGCRTDTNLTGMGYFTNTNFNNNTTDIYLNTEYTSSRVHFNNCYFTPAKVANGMAGTENIAYFDKVNGIENSSYCYNVGYNINSQSSITHSGSGSVLAWKVSPFLAGITSYNPAILPLGFINVVANKQVTVSCWLYRDDVGIVANLFLRRNQIAGVDGDIYTTASGSANTWEQLSINFTPTESGNVDIEVNAYGGTTYSVYVDDLSYTQGGNTYTDSLDRAFKGLPYVTFEEGQDMTVKRPLCIYNGELEELRTTDSLPSIGPGGIGLSFEATQKPTSEGIYSCIIPYDILIPTNCEDSVFNNEVNPSTTVEVLIKVNDITRITLSVDSSGNPTWTNSEIQITALSKITFLFPVQDSLWAGIIIFLNGIRS